jgi:phage FluMu protein Com
LPEDLLEEVVFKEFYFTLCPRCKEIYCANPLHLPLDNVSMK